MGSRAAVVVPFVIAVLLPPAGLLIGFVALTQPDRNRAYWLIVVALLAAVVWALLLFG